MDYLRQILDIQSIPVGKGDSFADMQPGDYVMAVTLSPIEEMNIVSLEMVTNDFSLKDGSFLYTVPAIPNSYNVKVTPLMKPIRTYTTQCVVETPKYFGASQLYIIRIPTRMREEVWKLWKKELEKGNYNDNVRKGFINLTYKLIKK